MVKYDYNRKTDKLYWEWGNLEKKIDFLFFSSWAVSIIATFGSLYFSEVKQYFPCELCWFQRILMYPLTVLLGVAYVRKDWKMSFYAIILLAIGGSIPIFHYSLQKLPLLQGSVDFCDGISCTVQYINWFGFITIPFLALTAFIIIFALSLMTWRQVKGGN